MILSEVKTIVASYGEVSGAFREEESKTSGCGFIYLLCYFVPFLMWVCWYKRNQGNV